VSSAFTPQHRGGAGSPLVCLHGFTDTWRTWELVLPALERSHDVLAPTLLAHAGGPSLQGEISDTLIVDAVEAAMDAAGFATADVVGNSLGGYIALQLAARGRADSVVALAPAGGWALGDPELAETLAGFTTVFEQLKLIAPQAEAIVSTPEGRRLVTQLITANYEHIPAELLAHQMVGVTKCEVPALVAYGEQAGFDLDAEKIECPVRIVWGTADQILKWPSSAARFRDEWLPTAEYIELDGIGHCPQLDVPLEVSELILGFGSR
jgi:pimeloyl-ACP methyl ester carboxylesterase